MAHRICASACLAVLLALAADDAEGQQAPSGPNRWFVSAMELGGVSRVSMGYYTVEQQAPYDFVLVQCVRGRWSFGLSRNEPGPEFPFGGPEPLNGWWQVDEEPAHGPIPLGTRGRGITMEDEALTARLRAPVRDSIKFRVVLGTREWQFQFGSNGLAEAVASFHPACES